MQLLGLGCLINLNVTTLGVGVLSSLDPSGSLHVMVDTRQTGRIIVYAKESQQCVCRCANLPRSSLLLPVSPQSKKEAWVV